MLCDSNYSIYKDTRKSVSGLVAKIGETLLTFMSKTQKNVTLRKTEAEYAELSECTK